MANIGIFKPTRSGYEGSITTLTLCTSAQIVPNRRKQKDTSPDFFVKSGSSDLGVAWKATSQGDDKQDYLRVVLDDPSFPQPIHAALFDRSDGADLVWKRRAKTA